jgi:tetratricopeptide (TPR) repeat protein
MGRCIILVQSILVSIVLAIFIFSCAPNIDQLISKAKKLEKKGQYKKAIEVYEKIIRQKPLFQDVRFRKAYCSLLDSNYSDALKEFKSILFLKGIVDDNGKTKQFIMELNPNMPFADEEAKHQVSFKEVYYQMGITYYYMAVLDSAYIYFQDVVNRNYRKAESLEWQGLIWVSADSFDKGCGFFRQAEQLGESNATTLIKQYCK